MGFALPIHAHEDRTVAGGSTAINLAVWQSTSCCFEGKMRGVQSRSYGMVYDSLAAIGRLAINSYRLLQPVRHIVALSGLLRRRGDLGVQSIASTAWLTRFRYGPIE